MRFAKTFTVFGCHAEGEVGNVITGGVGDVPGSTIFDKRLHLEEHQDQIRQLVLLEPRGAVVQNANLILPSSHPGADMGYVILEVNEYPAMSGSNTICVATVLLESGMLPMTEPVTELVLEAPGGLISVSCDCTDGKVTSVRFTNQPSFVYAQDVPIEIVGFDPILIDVAYGGMTYALVKAADVGMSLVPAEARDLCVLGQRIKAALYEQVEAVHPENPLIRGVTQLSFTGPVVADGAALRSRNAVVVTPGRLDRSPCGTGTSARLAAMHARGEITVGQDFIHESIIGTEFRGRIERTTTVGDYPATVTSIAGQAWITGINQLGLDPTDPFPYGHTLNDTWMEIDG